MLLEFLIPKTTIAYKAPEQVVVERVVEEPIIEPETPENTQNKPINPICESYLDPYCSCVVYLQNKDIPIKGNAEDIEPNLFQLPIRGDVVLFKYGHAAYVEEVYNEYLFISEANYRKGTRTERLIPIYSKDIKGYWRTPLITVELEGAK